MLVERYFNPPIVNCDKKHVLSSVYFFPKYDFYWSGNKIVDQKFSKWIPNVSEVVFHCPDRQALVDVTLKGPGESFCQEVKCPYWNRTGANIKALYKEEKPRR